MTEPQAPPKAQRALAGAPPGSHLSAVLTGDETGDEVIRRSPGLRLTMMSYGLSTGCSGNLSIRPTAPVGRFPLAVLLTDLRRELANDA